MEALAVIVILAVAAIAITVALRSRGGGDRSLPAPSAADEQRALHGDVRRLGAGDVVTYEGTDFVVDRTLRFQEEGFSWDEHLLEDEVGGRRLWLSVEDDEGLQVTVYERLAGAALEPGPAQLEHRGTTFRRDQHGRAAYRTEERAGPGGKGAMEYVEYVAGDRRLAFERYGTGGWEVSAGTVIPEHALDLYPAS
ncbi:MAG: DUF4178 domain-containing protein [Actinobacteria bacterium]|nr:DUF4178 domain-containing protein [Actinomycetota bacterium]